MRKIWGDNNKTNREGNACSLPFVGQISMNGWYAYYRAAFLDFQNPYLLGPHFDYCYLIEDRVYEQMLNDYSIGSDVVSPLVQEYLVPKDSTNSIIIYLYEKYNK